MKRYKGEIKIRHEIKQKQFNSIQSIVEREFPLDHFVLLSTAAFFSFLLLHLAASRFVCQWNVEVPKAFLFPYKAVTWRSSPGHLLAAKSFLACLSFFFFSPCALARRHGSHFLFLSLFICAGSRLTHLVA
jgi:hypothetical protein